ncbi:MAG TPA: hypothetical protein VHO66_00815 [Ruminiclostridium sp.]|nr:hypothetical protein [Ruminiclostridium sp.]
MKLKSILILSLCLLSTLSACSAKKPSTSKTSSLSSSITSKANAASSSIDSSKESIKEAVAAAANPVNLADKSHSVYEGTLNGQKVLLDIYKSGNVLAASYINSNETEEHEMTGLILKGRISLSAKGGSDKLTAISGSEDTLNVTYTSGSKKSESTFSLSHVTASDSATERYNGYDSKKVESFAAEIKEYIKNGDKSSLSKLISYPIKVNIDGQQATINSSDKFIADYDSIVNDNFKDALENTYTKFMFNNWQGILLGSGKYNFWFSQIKNGEMKITAINN